MGKVLTHMAMSLDGRISLGNSISTTLSGENALRRVHELRHEHDAILVGSNTAFVDDPSLTDRSEKPRRRKLVRVILDNRLRIPIEANVVKTAKETPTIVISNSGDEEKIEPPQKNPHAQALSKLGASKGGKARAKKLSSAKRKAIAEKAAQARWPKKG